MFSFKARLELPHDATDLAYQDEWDCGHGNVFVSLPPQKVLKSVAKMHGDQADVSEKISFLGIIHQSLDFLLGPTMEKLPGV